MNGKNRIRGFYFITDRGLSRKTSLEDVDAAVKGGARVVQYREKGRNLVEFLIEAYGIKRMCDEKRVLFLINDGVGAALLTDSGGVHLGQDDMPLACARRILGKKVIGVTAHNVNEAAAAEIQGADYVGLSPIFQTKTKPDAGPAAGLDLIREVKKKVGIPCVAIGGINEGNVDFVIAAGADSVSAISATVPSYDVEKAVRMFARKFEK
jgi:thiamine-phosphate pyrophosphorylase